MTGESFGADAAIEMGLATAKDADPLTHALKIAEHIADQLEHWFKTGAADGFNVLAPTLPHGLKDFAELVIPELQRRGLFRTEYTGRTLSEHLGLRRPAHPIRNDSPSSNGADDNY